MSALVMVTREAVAPRADAPTPTVILLQGLTYPADQLVPMAAHLGDALPHVRLLVPAAPVELEGFAGGRSWWPISVGRMLRQRGRGEHQDLTAARPPGMDGARDAVLAVVAACPGPVALVGFSQGAMLAVDVALAAPERVAAIGLVAGTIVDEADWRRRATAAAGLPVLMLHAPDDEVLRHDVARRLATLLADAGARVEFVDVDGGHAVPPSATPALAAFLARALPPP
ncbi:MAG: hypothetical protein R2939_21920 [Kofleriaceae bacterium]